MIDWREVHGALVAIAAKRSALDADEAKWLREAEQLQIWRRFGMVSALDYLERVLGYAPHTANERLRVARLLGELPEIEAALGRGEIMYSAAREISRVVTRDTESEWLDAVRGKSLRVVEDLVAGKHRGDRPGDASKEEARIHRVTLELSADVYARLREIRTQLADEHDRHLDDDALVSALCDAATSSEPGRARFQIAVSVCPTCDHATQDGGGRAIPIDDAALDRARCDAQHIGSLDAAHPERATQEIPPATVRLVWRRAHGRCQSPGCRSARGLEVHHVIHREHGGTHEPSNLILLCSACHLAHHRGQSHVGPSAAADARTALETLGYSRSEAKAAVDLALKRTRADSLDGLLREALRACSVSREVVQVVAQMHQP